MDSTTVTEATHPETPARRKRELIAFVREHLATWLANGLVFGSLTALFVYGHRTGWTLPKFSELLGKTETVVEPICPEHLVPMDICIECKPELWPKPESYGFCWEHGVAECVLHHPHLAQTNSDPVLPKYDTLEALRQIPRRENNSRSTLHERRIQFASHEAFEKTGIEVDFVREAPMVEVIKANGELAFDPNYVAHITSRAPGVVVLSLHALGDVVARGDLLGLIESQQVGQAKSQFLQSIVQHNLRRSVVERMAPIAASGAVPQKSFAEAESALREAEVQLTSARLLLSNLGFKLDDLSELDDAETAPESIRFLGIPQEALNKLLPENRTANLLPIRSSIGGEIITTHMVPGEVIDQTTWLATICDPTKMWLDIHVRSEDARFLQHDQEVRFRTALDEPYVSGTIRWISPAIDEATRTIQVRVPIDNANGVLRDRTFVTAEIILRQQPNAVVVPSEAVQSTSDGQFIFVRHKTYFDADSPKFFQVRQVRVGAVHDGKTELLAGAVVGEVVATRGSQSLMAQLFRSSFGEGCGCFE